MYVCMWLIYGPFINTSEIISFELVSKMLININMLNFAN